MIKRLFHWFLPKFYLITIIQESPFWRVIFTLQYDKDVDLQIAQEHAEWFRNRHAPPSGWVTSRVESGIRRSNIDQRGRTPNISESFLMGSHYCLQRAEPIIHIENDE